MRFKTMNRVYEVDEGRRLIRQVGGPTRAGEQRLTAEWREYKQLFVELGHSATIEWPDSTPRLLSTSPNYPTIPMTVTSKVVEIATSEDQQP